MKVLVTGAAGFIGSSTSHVLLERGEQVVGLDNINDYYDIQLKELRLSRLREFKEFSFVKADICDFANLRGIFRDHGPFHKVVHLAANAGVRYSQNFPLEVVNSNVVGHTNILELCRQTENFEHLVFASSSSVYPHDGELPYSIDCRVDRPVSVYAATKAAGELISHVYSDNFYIPQTALRYFTVYGPWGRPDMSYYLFTDAIVNSKQIQVFNFGDMRRDFTYIDDIVAGTILALDKPPQAGGQNAPIQTFNLGAGKSEPLEKLISLIEEKLGEKAIKNLEAGPRGEMLETLADIEFTRNEIGFSPSVALETGIARFVEWYRWYHKC